MPAPQDRIEGIQAVVREAASRGQSLQIRGGGTRDFYGRAPVGDVLSVSDHQGVVAYEPSELVITARAGTPLGILEATLNQRGQALAFEPPLFGDGATLGGAIATGMSGPGRPYAGSARDFVLGIKCVNGRGECLAFGGQVIKNVAGYDVSRLMTGALGTLGVLLEVSLKVLPVVEREQTLVLATDSAQAIVTMSELAAKPLPITAACYHAQMLYLRLSGSNSGVAAAGRQIGGDVDAQGSKFWAALRDHDLPFFDSQAPLWRLSVPPATPPLELEGQWFVDWGGSQRWLKTDQDMDMVRRVAAAAGGHATLFRGGERSSEVFHPLAPANKVLHQNLKRAFDPQGILNPGRLYSDL